jgi:hypothetical protein
MLSALLVLWSATAAAAAATATTSIVVGPVTHRPYEAILDSRRRVARLLLLMQLRGGGQEDDAAAANTVDGFELLSDTVIYEKWRRLVSRKVRLPSGRTADFEIVGQSAGGTRNDEDDVTDQAVLIFVWHTATKTATLIREYMPALHRKCLGLAAGMVEADKHAGNSTGADEDNMQWTAAQHELEEECVLTGGQWIRLTERPVTMDKYSTTALTVYLVLDPVPLEQHLERPRDDTEEGMDVVPNVTVEELLQRMMQAEMTVVGSWASLLALRKLREMGEIQ